jgi:hypothetical protein
MASSETIGNALKGRVTACRKRLRVNRSVNKAQVNDEPAAFGREIAGAVLDEDPTVREALVCEREVNEFRDGGMATG